MTIITFTDFESGTIHRVEVPYTFQEMHDLFSRPPQDSTSSSTDPNVYTAPAILALPIPPTPVYLRRKPRRAKVDNGDGRKAMVGLALLVIFIVLLCIWSFVALGGFD